MSSKRISRLTALALASGVLGLAGLGCQGTGNSGARPRPRPGIAQNGDINRARALTSKADEAYRRGDFERADTLYRESLQIFPSQTGAWNNLGNVLMAQTNYKDAQAAFRRAIELEPDRPEPYTSMGRLWLEAKYAEDSIEHFDEALAIDPRWLPAIRGKSAANHMLSRATPEYIDLLRTGLLIESDPAWRKFFDRERSRAQQALDYEG